MNINMYIIPLQLATFSSRSATGVCVTHRAAIATEKTTAATGRMNSTADHRVFIIMVIHIGLITDICILLSLTAGHREMLYNM